MPIAPTYLFHVLSSQTRMMSRDCEDERFAIILKNVALGSLILMTAFAGKQILKDLSERPGRDWRR